MTFAHMCTMIQVKTHRVNEQPDEQRFSWKMAVKQRVWKKASSSSRSLHNADYFRADRRSMTCLTTQRVRLKCVLITHTHLRDSFWLSRSTGLQQHCQWAVTATFTFRLTLFYSLLLITLCVCTLYMSICTCMCCLRMCSTTGFVCELSVIYSYMFSCPLIIPDHSTHRQKSANRRDISRGGTVNVCVACQPWCDCAATAVMWCSVVTSSVDSTTSLARVLPYDHEKSSQSYDSQASTTGGSDISVNWNWNRN